MIDKTRGHADAQARRKDITGRLACPVCLGVKMEKAHVSPTLELDVCPRCGGMWFDAGELAQLRQYRPKALWKHVPQKAGDYRMKCHECLASFPRNKEACPACGHPNTLACPKCAVAMTRATHGELIIDVCRKCRGAWFDNVELAQVWNTQVSAMERRRPAGDAAAMSDDMLVMHALIWTDPSVLYLGAHVVANAAPAAGAIIEGTGELAGSFFESIGDIIGGAFEALGDIF